MIWIWLQLFPRVVFPPEPEYGYANFVRHGPLRVQKFESPSSLKIRNQGEPGMWTAKIIWNQETFVRNKKWRPKEMSYVASVEIRTTSPLPTARMRVHRSIHHTFRSQQNHHLGYRL
ncbi:hypothetical protein GCK32_022618 [Trichostrongylus colubriformis]|uniref:Uncharacterized protein n=1 Tax=Trichostrongylus colubriformis TaxID=6319 RepID=A0AAN8G4T3_TRICO